MKSYKYCLFIFFMIMLHACGSQRRLDVAEKPAESTAVAHGRELYKLHCDKCHPGGEAGVGLPLNNINLPGFLTRYRIRSRSFLLWTGKMPAFDRKEISAEEMDHLVAYIKQLHHSKSTSLSAGR